MYDMMTKLNKKESSDPNTKGLKWVCRMCDRSLPTLKEMNNTLGSIMKTNNERFDAIEAQVKKVEDSIGEKVSDEVMGLKDKLMSEISVEIDRKLDEKCKEESDRRYREMNLCFFNVPVSSDPDPKVRKDHDLSAICSLYRAIVKDEEPTDPQIKNAFRLQPAKRNSTSGEPGSRVIKATFVNKHEMRLFLSNARFIKENKDLDKNLQKVIIAKDLSIKEREENRKLREELKERNKEGNNFTIRNGKIVPKVATPSAATGGPGDMPPSI